MASIFLDTSALVKLYVREVGTDEMMDLASDPGTDALILLSLSRVELRSAVRRRERLGEIASEGAARILSSFASACSDRFLVQPTTEIILEESLALIDRHGLRAYDAVQLAGYLAFVKSSPSGDSLFVSSDENLLEAARGEGIDVFNPGGVA